MQEIAHQPVLFQELDITDEAALQELFRKVRAGAALPWVVPGVRARGGSHRSREETLCPTFLWAMEPPGLAEWSSWGSSGWFLPGAPLSCCRGTDARPVPPCSTVSRP